MAETGLKAALGRYKRQIALLRREVERARQAEIDAHATLVEVRLERDALELRCQAMEFEIHEGP